MKGLLIRKLVGLFILLVLVVFGYKSAFALNVEINVKNSFSEGDRIEFSYVVSSDKEEDITFMPAVECPNKPMPPLMTWTASVGPSHPYHDIYQDIVVGDWLEPQKCKAIISILSPIQKTFSKEFLIDTKPSFDFSLEMPEVVFTLKDKIFINYSSGVPNPKIRAKLTFPDNNTQNISLPYIATPRKTGTYTIEVRAEKEGYKPVKVKRQFAVIKEEPKIRRFNAEEILREREREEKKENEDVNKRGHSPSRSLLYLMMIGLISIIILLILLLFKGGGKNV